MTTPRLPWSIESAYMAFAVFGESTQSPCPACFAGWGTRVDKRGVVHAHIQHARNCQFKQWIKSDSARLSMSRERSAR